MAKNNISEFVTLQDAAQMAGLPLETLTTLVQTGKTRAARFNGEVLISVSQVKKARRASVGKVSAPEVDRAQFKHLDGRAIRLSDAAIKYDISKKNLSVWARKGLVHVLERGPKIVLLNEADIAFADAFARANGGTYMGKRVFPRVAL